MFTFLPLLFIPTDLNFQLVLFPFILKNFIAHFLVFITAGENFSKVFFSGYDFVLASF